MQHICTMYSSMEVSLSLLLRFCHYSYSILWWNKGCAVGFCFSFYFLSTVENIIWWWEKNIAQLCSMFDWTSHKTCSSFCSTINTFVTYMCYASIITRLNPFRSNTLTPWLYFIGRPVDSPKTNNSTNEGLLFDASMATHMTTNYTYHYGCNTLV